MMGRMRYDFLNIDAIIAEHVKHFYGKWIYVSVLVVITSIRVIQEFAILLLTALTLRFC